MNIVYYLDYSEGCEVIIHNLPKNVFNNLSYSLSLFNEDDFDGALEYLETYKSESRQDLFLNLVQNKKIVNKYLSIIIVFWGDDHVYDCIDSINKAWLNFKKSGTLNNDIAISHESHFEIILINNTSKHIDFNSSEYNFDISILNTNCNIKPSESRNFGAIVSNGDWLYFLDDDATVDIGFFKNFETIFRKRHAARGLIKTRKFDKVKIPDHYSMGKKLKESELNIEGNLLVRRSLFLSVGGFDPLMYAHEGKDLTRKILAIVNNNEVVYDPNLVVYHDPDIGKAADEKKIRNARSLQYMNYKQNLYLDRVKCLVIVLLSEIESLSYLKTLVDSNPSLGFQFIIITDVDIEVQHTLKRYSLFHQTIVVPKHFNNFGVFDRFNYSILMVMNPKKDVSKLNIRSLISEVFRDGLSKSNKEKTLFLTYLNFFGYSHNDSIEIQAVKLLDEMYKNSPVFVRDDISSAAIINDQEIFKSVQVISRDLGRKDVIVISFHTTDAYYTTKSCELKKQLDLLDICYDIQPVVIPEGMKWPDVCRKKVQFYFTKFNEYRDRFKKVVWIDVDCNLNYIPSFIYDFDVDFMAFRRGFPNSKHKEKLRTRYWEPCFFVFKTSESCYKMLKHASDLEIEMTDIQATDDYFFEEAWRKYGNTLSSFAIPGEMSTRGNKQIFNQVESRNYGVFFAFGDSGNVQNYKGKVIQHVVDKNLIIKSDTPNKSSVEYTIPKLIDIARRNRKDLFEPSKTLNQGVSENDRELVRSLTCYEGTSDNILLNWWIRPAPGNMGDWLSPYIISRLTGYNIRYESAPKAKLISLGSIGKFTRDHHTVWGTGISTRGVEMSKNARYLAVRGPYTAEAIRLAGGMSPNVFGDPAIVLPQLYKPKKIFDASYGLVRHFIHQNCDLKIDDDIKDINIMLSSPEDIENFIDTLYSCSAVVTTSLHVLILCISYNIPCRLINIDEKDKGVHGDGIKYKDFFEGVGIKPKMHVDFGSTITKSSIENAVIQENSIDVAIINELKNSILNDLSNNPSFYM